MGACITGLGYWAVGIPITCLLVFWKSYGIVGIWIGPTASCVFITIAYQIIVTRMDWQTLISENRKQQAEQRKVEPDTPVKTDANDNDYEKANKLN